MFHREPGASSEWFVVDTVAISIAGLDTAIRSSAGPCTGHASYGEGSLDGGGISSLMSKRGTIAVGSGTSRKNDKPNTEKKLHSTGTS
jgi:hypothetical protein